MVPSATSWRESSTLEGPETIGAPCRKCFIAVISMNWHDDTSWYVSVECAEVLRANARQLSRPLDGMPQLITIRFGPDDSSKDRQPAWASWLTLAGGGTPVSMITVIGPPSRRWKPECGMPA